MSRFKSTIRHYGAPPPSFKLLLDRKDRARRRPASAFLLCVLPLTRFFPLPSTKISWKSYQIICCRAHWTTSPPTPFVLGNKWGLARLNKDRRTQAGLMPSLPEKSIEVFFPNMDISSCLQWLHMCNLCCHQQLRGLMGPGIGI